MTVSPADVRPPMVFVHGFWSTELVWSALAERYAGAGHEVHCPRLPLHDRPLSEAPPDELGSTGFGDYLGAVLDAVDAASAPPLLVGHSAGGLLALLAAARRRVAGLALLAPAPPAGVFAVSMSALRTFGPILLERTWWRSPVALEPAAIRYGVLNEVPPEEAAEAANGLVWESGRAFAQVALPWFGGAGASSVDLSRLDMPALLIVGEKDRLTTVRSVRRIARRLGGPVSYREIPGAGHWLFHAAAREKVVLHLDELLVTLRGRGGGAPAGPDLT